MTYFTRMGVRKDPFDEPKPPQLDKVPVLPSGLDDKKQKKKPMAGAQDAIRSTVSSE